jgi:hypothetical protein
MKKVREKEEIMKENVIKFIKNNWRWMLLFICLIGFLALAEEVFHQEIMNGDIVGYDIVSKLFKFNVSTPIAKFITNFGGAIFVISLTTILFFVIKDKKIALKENTTELLERAYHLSGNEEDVDKYLSENPDVEVLDTQKMGRSKGVSVLMKTSGKLDKTHNLSVQPLTLQNLFAAMCGEVR